MKEKKKSGIKRNIINFVPSKKKKNLDAALLSPRQQPSTKDEMKINPGAIMTLMLRLSIALSFGKLQSADCTSSTLRRRIIHPLATPNTCGHCCMTDRMPKV